MAKFAADPQALALTCPKCKARPLLRCLGYAGQQVPIHAARRRAAREAMSHG